VIRRGTRPVKNRLAVALRQAAPALHREQSYLGAFHRRLRARLGPAAAVTATAHKLARDHLSLGDNRRSLRRKCLPTRATTLPTTSRSPSACSRSQLRLPTRSP
jgi:hypothetical protein